MRKLARHGRFSSLVAILMVLILLSSSVVSAQPIATRQAEPKTAAKAPIRHETVSLAPPQDQTTVSVPAAVPAPTDSYYSDLTALQQPATNEDASNSSAFIHPATDEQIAQPPLPTPSCVPPSCNPYDPVTIDVTSDQQATLQSKDGKVKITFPVGAVTEKVHVEYREQSTLPSTGMRMVRLFQVNGYAVNRGNAPVNTFSQQLQISITHTRDELRGLDTRSLHLYYLDLTQHRWLPVSGQYDPTTNTVTSSTNHFSYYGELANPNISGPGQVLAFQVGLQSGTAVSSYPIELPPGPGGFQPKLELTYNSGAADEMKNKRSVGSWVGIGWTLHPGRIRLDEQFNTYYLDLNGASYEIASTGGGYYTKPDMFFKITRTGQTWDVWDKDGIKYEFGGTTDSQQYHDSSTYYRWDLNLAQDVHGNQMTVSYSRDIVGTSVRSAYPEYLTYNSNLVQVHFYSSNDRQDPTDGPVRIDDPLSTSSNPAPQVMENRKLDSIEVWAGSPLTLARKYNFTYYTISGLYSYDYGGIDYSGVHTLSSITQVGADGTSTLPGTTFTYQNLQTYLNDSYNPAYSGNPGNPASFTWPHLTQVTNGYGATVTFTYTQNPSNSTNDIWTREVVTGRTVNPGIGPVQTYSYTYTGNPRYMWHAWDARFKGFDSVRETDAAGNYVQHYFYTTGQAADGKDADKLSGKEWKTQWYDSANNLLKEMDNDWEATVPSQDQNIYAFVTQFDSPDSGRFQAPVTLAIDGNYIYVVDAGWNAVFKFDVYGNQITRWGSLGSTQGRFNFGSTAAGITTAGGNVYVADYYNDRIQAFNGSGWFLAMWPGIKGWPNDVKFNSANSLLYTMEDSWVTMYTTGGQLAGAWGPVGTIGPLGIDPAGNVYVLDSLHNVVTSYTSSGDGLVSWGGSGSGNGYFSNPTGIKVDSSHNVFVVDHNNSRVQKFNSSGVYITKWGTSGGGFGSFNSSYGVEVGADGTV